MWKGKLNIYSEVCCDYCNEVVHNHLDCPVCNKKHASSDNYHNLSESREWNDGVCTLECECGAKFNTKDYPYDDDAIWEQVS